MPPSQTQPWAATGCLLCGAEHGHDDGCAGANPDAVEYLTEHVDPATTRSWTMAGVRYTATPQRRAAITALMPTMTRYQAGRKVSLPFSVGLLVKEIVPKMGIGRWLANVGYHPAAVIEVPDCSCTDLLRCRCDFDGHPHAHAHPDRWASCGLLVLRLRRPQGWLDLWLLDIGTGAVVIAEDDIGNDPIPTDASNECRMGWCDLCAATTTIPNPASVGACAHRCHTRPQPRQRLVPSPPEHRRSPERTVMSFREFPVADAVVRVYDRNPDSDDASDMYVLEVFGISVLVRLRAVGPRLTDRPQLYVHIDNESRDRTELAVEVRSGGDALHNI